MGGQLVPRFGSYDPNLHAMSYAYIQDLTVFERIRELAILRVPGMATAGTAQWRELFVRAMTAIFVGWQKSGWRIVPGPPTPFNVVVLAPDFRQGATTPSLSPLLRRVFGLDVLCSKCKAPLRLISIIKGQPIARKILVAMHLPAEVPELHPARPPPERDGAGQESEDWVNRSGDLGGTRWGRLPLAPSRALSCSMRALAPPPSARRSTLRSAPANPTADVSDGVAGFSDAEETASNRLGSRLGSSRTCRRRGLANRRGPPLA
jgi:hypothetical protein